MDNYTITRWWCVRHAFVPESAHKGLFYGAQDVDCEPCDVKSKWLSQVLPQDAVLITSALKRTHQTADAFIKQGLITTAKEQYSDLNEQSFGDWEQRTFADVFKDRNENFWWAPAHTRAGGGESFTDLYSRVANSITEINEKHAGKDIIAVTHGGTIRASIAFALSIPMESALNVNIDNQSITLLEHFKGEGVNTWRCCYMNRLPQDTANGQ